MNEPAMVEMGPSASLALFLLIPCLTITPGVSGQVTWVVTMTHDSICAVIGSSVEMPCSFTHQHKPDLIVNKVYWGINPIKDMPLADVLYNPKYTGRVKYNKDMKKTCTLILSDVRVSDTTAYYARIETTTSREKWQSNPVTLTVKDFADLVVQTSGTAVEGEHVKLSCNSQCTLRQNSMFMWKKDEKVLPGTPTNNNELIFHNIRIEDAGSYSCELNHQQYRPSPPVKIDVKYPPKNTSVSISPAGEILEGATVTLTCSNVANPPVESYRWYKRRETAPSLVGSKQIYRINKITSGHTGHYYCVVKNQHGGSESTAVFLDVQYAPKKTSASVSPSGEILEGVSVTLTCSSDANPPVQSYTWYKKEKSESVMLSTQQVYSISKAHSEHTGYYYCQAENKHGHLNSTIINLDVLHPPKGTLVSHNHTGDLKEGSSVTLSCSSDANPPVESYTWYRNTGDETTEVGSAETITFTLVTTTAGLYHCKAKNRVSSEDSPGLKVSLAGSGWQSMAAIAGGAVAFLIVLIVVLAVLMSRKKNTTNSTIVSGSTVRNSQGAADNDYVNVNPVTSHPGQSVDSGDQDDVQYASVQFKRSREQEVPVYSTVEEPKLHSHHQEQEEVQYAAVNFSRPTAATHTGADTDVYSAVSKPRNKKACGQRTAHQQ
ncbi:B-cell receptor CD22-like isoform X2 [Alosa pseudoharengus]|uniref:B-cell receptor CD22-like isoform X2 n=1 Tax=Alosa pseudoharengus TaxID=34774 RepID=UPI003F8BC72A